MLNDLQTKIIVAIALKNTLQQHYPMRWKIVFFFIYFVKFSHKCLNACKNSVLYWFEQKSKDDCNNGIYTYQFLFNWNSVEWRNKKRISNMLQSTVFVSKSPYSWRSATWMIWADQFKWKGNDYEAKWKTKRNETGEPNQTETLKMRMKQWEHKLME